MAYRVEITARAKRDLSSIRAYIHAEITPQAAVWLAGLEEAILSLEELPKRGTALKGTSYRQLLYGSVPHTYRILYRVDERARSVFVMHVRHGARGGSGLS